MVKEWGEAACAITNSPIAVTNGRSAQRTVRPLSVSLERKLARIAPHHPTGKNMFPPPPTVISVEKSHVKGSTTEDVTCFDH